MELKSLFEKHEIPLNSLFVHCKVKAYEGLIFFKVIVEEANEEENKEASMSLEPFAILVDDSKLVFNPELCPDITIHGFGNNIELLSLTSDPVNISYSDFEDFPFAIDSIEGYTKKEINTADLIKVD